MVDDPLTAATNRSGDRMWMTVAVILPQHHACSALIAKKKPAGFVTNLAGSKRQLSITEATEIKLLRKTCGRLTTQF